MKCDTRQKYKEALIQSLIKDKDKWTRKFCYADIGWFDYYSPMYGSAQFEVDNCWKRVNVLVNGRELLRIDYGIFDGFRLWRLIKDMEKHVDGVENGDLPGEQCELLRKSLPKI